MSPPSDTVESFEFRNIQARRPLDIECNDDRLKSILIVTERYVENVISMSKLAESVGISRRQLERLFQDKTGRSPGKIYKELRMHRERELLLQSEASLIEVALKVGFENAAHLAKAFKRTYGKTPTQVKETSAQ